MKHHYTQILDDFNPRVQRQNRGAFKGQPLYYKNKYKFALIDEHHPKSHCSWVASIKRRPNTALVSNFNYRSKLYLAEIPLDSLNHMHLMSVPFKEKWIFVFSHAQMLLEFKHPVLLYPQNKFCKDAVPISVYRFIYSYNYVGGYDSQADSWGVEQYSPLGGFWFARRRYEGTHNLIDFHDWKDYELQNFQKAKESPERGVRTSRRSPTILYEIDVSKIQLSTYLRKQLCYGNLHNAHNKKYETFFRNCGNVLLRNVIDCLQQPCSKISRFSPKNMLAYYSPARIHLILRFYGILKSKSDLVTFLKRS